MSLITKNIIPGEQGKVFGTNAMNENELVEIKNSLLTIEGIKEVQLNLDIFPKEFTVFTTKMIPITTIENKVKTVGFHAIPK
mgnify:FL=1|tara:strand:+ start:4596 stop:4841 length:246 start_codon:yes stop_codon:yes gene_type:complete